MAFDLALGDPLEAFGLALDSRLASAAAYAIVSETQDLKREATRADREGGWMQLRLRDAQRTIRIDSELDGFAELVRRAANEAARHGLLFDAATARNLEALP